MCLELNFLINKHVVQRGIALNIFINGKKVVWQWLSKPGCSRCFYTVLFSSTEIAKASRQRGVMRNILNQESVSWAPFLDLNIYTDE